MGQCLAWRRSCGPTARWRHPHRFGRRPATLAPDAMSTAASVLGGSISTSASGAIILVDRHYAASELHGRVRIGDIVETLLDAHEARDSWPRGPPSPRLAAGQPRLPPRRAPADSRLPTPDSRQSLWFLDLETTGLAGGAGTQAFLVGCATIDRDGISLRQFLLPGYEHEPTLLAEVAAWAAARGAIVTFNGKSFDVPLIETRYLFHRVPFPLEGMAHVDMLHPARRLWRARGTMDGGARGQLLARHARAAAGRSPSRRRRAGLRDSRALLPVRPRRRCAAARGGAGAQPPRPGVAGAGDGARADADRARARRHARCLRVPRPGAGLRQRRPLRRCRGGVCPEHRAAESRRPRSGNLRRGACAGWPGAAAAPAA